MVPVVGDLMMHQTSERWIIIGERMSMHLNTRWPFAINNQPPYGSNNTPSATVNQTDATHEQTNTILTSDTTPGTAESSIIAADANTCTFIIYITLDYTVKLLDCPLGKIMRSKVHQFFASKWISWKILSDWTILILFLHENVWATRSL